MQQRSYFFWKDSICKAVSVFEVRKIGFQDGGAGKSSPLPEQVAQRTLSGASLPEPLGAKKGTSSAADPPCDTSLTISKLG
jgi:hypothetical protein